MVYVFRLKVKLNLYMENYNRKVSFDEFLYIYAFCIYDKYLLCC